MRGPSIGSPGLRPRPRNGPDGYTYLTVAMVIVHIVGAFTVLGALRIAFQDDGYGNHPLGGNPGWLRHVKPRHHRHGRLGAQLPEKQGVMTAWDERRIAMDARHRVVIVVTAVGLAVTSGL